ncbi:THUMP-like domain-containing protein [Mycolicibacterium confluentis]|uniref:THUMP-like domain-containing protein n=1 Tax=Mycolicibacterium confluentis TaxID=28047 RepID=UPI0023E2778B
MVLQRDDHRSEALLKFTLDDVAYLTSDEGVAALADVAALPSLDGVRDVAVVRERHAARAPVLIETTLLRRRAVAKLPDAGQWLFTDEALQQATAEPVAAHRALRLAGRVVHDVTCSVGADLAALRRTAAEVVGSDLDPVRVAMARHNLGGEVLICRADALHPVTRDAAVVADPARRSEGRRRFDPREYMPALDDLLEVCSDRDLAVKCAPGIDFDALGDMGFRGEVEITSWAGSVREACLWSPGLGESGVTRRATVLDTGEQLTDAEDSDCEVGPVGRWIVDPDGAVVRAGLVRHYAARHGLWQLDPEIAYLSGDTVPPGVRGFEVIEELAFTEKALRQALSVHDCGVLEILVRGVNVNPDELRRRLRLRGTVSLSVVITRIGAGANARRRAFICRSVPVAASI